MLATVYDAGPTLTHHCFLFAGMSPSEIKAATSALTMAVSFPYKYDTLNQRRLNVVPKSAMLAVQ